MQDAHKLVSDWYEEKMQKQLLQIQSDAITNMLKSGLTASMLMDCVDRAHLTCGFTAFAPDCWRAFHKETEQEYKSMKKQFPD